MDHKKIRVIGALILAAVWVVLTGFAWFGPAEEMSEAERRPLEQLPALSAQSLLSGDFMESFEDYSLDQFPLRDFFRRLKSLFHRYVLGQRDNNGIYIADGYAAELDYPLDEASVSRALQQFERVYQSYLRDSGSVVFAAVVPDKGYYLAEENGYPAMDHEKLFSMVREGMPWASHVDLADCLTIEDYYYTDTHWRQERLLPAAQKLAQAMGITAPEAEDFTATELERPFYGVYYGQAALPMDPEHMYLMESALLSACRVYNHEKDAYTQVYDLTRLSSQDLYEVYLSGAQSLLTIENPNAATDRELIVFRDSFGSSMVPLLVADYASVTLVDIRYINIAFLNRYLDFRGQDVLFLYSTLVLNSGSL